MQIKNIIKNGIAFFLVCLVFPLSGYSQKIDWKSLDKYEKYSLLELTIEQENVYNDPFRDVELRVELKGPANTSLLHYGFYDGGNTWKIRYSPDATGIWKYKAYFSDGSKEISGAFGCIDNTRPGRVGKNEFNPFWLGKGGSSKDLFRSLHVGDKFMAFNWDDPTNPSDGNAREIFLDWIQEHGYNMLSIGSLFTNRDEDERGKGWDTPRPWPLDVEEFRKMELILDDLRDRDITVFPFAGFFGLKGNWPTDQKEQELYIKYLLARLGHYPNLILNIGGPEPTWRKESYAYQGAMRVVDIKRLGMLIDSLDVHDHILTVHNEKRATQYGDPFIDEPWYSMSTLQGPTTLCREELYSGLIMNHHRQKPAYAQETLWTGNVYHPDYSNDQLRKNAITILFSGSVLNLADNNGKSSTGFSGSLDLADANLSNHAIVKKVWDWFETLSFLRMTSRQDLVKQGFCLAAEGEEYYVYLDTIGEVELFLDFGYSFTSRWINAANPADVRPGPVVSENTVFQSPRDGNDWVLHVFASRPEIVAKGNFPNAAVDQQGNIHVVYNREGLKYKKFDVQRGLWSNESNTGCGCAHVERSAPKIVIDSKGQPHVFCGSEYAYFNGKKWMKSIPGGTRDTDIAIDSKDNVHLVHRGGNNGGYIGSRMKTPNNKNWITLPDADLDKKGYNDHVYTEIVFDAKDNMHLVQRKGPEVEVTYRQSTDGGKTWPVVESVVDQWDEAPHIAVCPAGEVYITSGIGELFHRRRPGEWVSLGKKVFARTRMQPEISIDNQGNMYITAFSGRVNTSYKSVWMGEQRLENISGNPVIGFVKTAPAPGFAYIIWEEGTGDAHDGLKDDAAIVVGRLFPDGRIIGIR